MSAALALKVSNTAKHQVRIQDHLIFGSLIRIPSHQRKKPWIDKTSKTMFSGPIAKCPDPDSWPQNVTRMHDKKSPDPAKKIAGSSTAVYNRDLALMDCQKKIWHRARERIPVFHIL